MNKKKVVVAMSGGVDSSVAAALLKKGGYEVIGAFMQNCTGRKDEESTCVGSKDLEDMKAVCKILDIPWRVFNFEGTYFKRLVGYFYKEYREGRTPNPDILCNKNIKFGAFLNEAKKLGADFFATGHYARILKNSGNSKFQIPNSKNKVIYHLLKGKDENKDQSYFLWMLGQEELKNVMFPIGELKKTEVRKIAGEFGLPVAKKKDSQGICFVGENKVRDFLKMGIKPKKGLVYDNEGRLIGEHEGVWFYTIGQRIGMSKVNWPEKDVPTLFVVRKDIAKNIIIAGCEDKLYGKGLICDNSHWVWKKPKMPVKLQAIIRYRHQAAGVLVDNAGEGMLKVIFNQPQRAITPGQSVVFYKGEELIGGGIIKDQI